MPKKRTLSPEHLAKLQAGRAAKQAAKKQAELQEQAGYIAQDTAEQEQDEFQTMPVPEAPASITPEVPAIPAQGVTLTQEQFQMILDRLASRPEPQASQETVNQNLPQLNQQGGVVGVIERFSVNPAHYKNPVEELYDTPELKRFGIRENFVLDWNVTPTKYQTAMGTWYIEPRFELVLKKKQFDEDNNELVKFDQRGNPYHPRIVWGRASFFEDPPANIMEADLAGVSIDDLDKPEFQEKMRMYRYRFWLMERISPKKPVWTTSNRREEVIGGKAYEIDNYSMPL